VSAHDVSPHDVPAAPLNDPVAANRARWWGIAAGIAGVLALIGIAAPRFAVTALLVGSLALTGVCAAYALARLLSRVRRAPRSEFAPALYERPPQVLPHHIARVVPTGDERKPLLTQGARAGIATVVTERLWATHHLNIHDPAHLERVEQLLPTMLWDCVRPDRVDKRGQLVPRNKLLHADLPRLLDEIESIR
jgi:hypothetical protein